MHIEIVFWNFPPQISTTTTTTTNMTTTTPPPRYVTASGTTRTSTPFSPTRVAWECVGIVDAFFRTLLVDGYAETYVANGRTTTTTNTTINGRIPGRREGGVGGGGGGARVSGFANVRTIDHSAPAPGG